MLSYCIKFSYQSYAIVLFFLITTWVYIKHRYSLKKLWSKYLYCHCSGQHTRSTPLLPSLLLVNTSCRSDYYLNICDHHFLHNFKCQGYTLIYLIYLYVVFLVFKLYVSGIILCILCDWRNLVQHYICEINYKLFS